MAIAREILEQLAAVNAGNLSLADFHKWLSRYAWNIHKRGDAMAQKLAYAIQGQLIQYERDCDELRADLKAIQDAFAERPRESVIVELFMCDIDGLVELDAPIIHSQGEAPEAAPILHQVELRGEYENEPRHSQEPQSKTAQLFELVT